MTSNTSAKVPALAKGVAGPLLHPTPSRPLPVGTPPYPPHGGGEGSRSTRPPRGVPEEHRALIREARSVWEKAARRCANPYVDSAALLLVGRMALEATQWEDGLVILQAIRDRIEPKSSPRRIPEWAREEGAKKRNTEHRDRKSAELNAPWDPAVLSAARAFLDARKRERYRAPTIRPDCTECGTLTHGRCAGCKRPVHPKVCSKRHVCARHER